MVLPVLENIASVHCRITHEVNMTPYFLYSCLQERSLTRDHTFTKGGGVERKILVVVRLKRSVEVGVTQTVIECLECFVPPHFSCRSWFIVSPPKHGLCRQSYMDSGILFVVS